MKNKHVGFLIIGVSALVLIIVFSFNQALENIVTQSCSHGTSCPMYGTLAVQKIVSYALTIMLALVGIILAFFVKDKPTIINQTVEKAAFPDSEQQEKILESLNEDEKKVMQKVFTDKGSVYQSALVKDLEINKVKITRILDSLEGKGLVERKRRGMSNMVIFKQ